MALLPFTPMAATADLSQAKLQVSILATGKSARGGVLRVGKPPDSSSFPRWLLQPLGEAITTIPSCAVGKQVLLGFCTQGSSTCPSSCLHHIRTLMRNLLRGKRSCRGGLRTQTEVCTGHCSGTGGKLSHRGFLGGAGPLGLLAAGTAGHTQTLPVHQLLPLQRAQRPLSAGRRKGQGAAFVCQPHPPQHHKSPNTSLRGCTEQRESGATITPTQARSTPLLGCFLASHALGSRASDTAREGPAEGSQHRLFSLCTAKEFLLCGAGFGTFQRRAAPAVPCRASTGTGAALAQAACPRHRDSDRDREVLTRI